MILIIVGVDCSGKDTLIEELHKRTGYDVHRGSSFNLTHGKSQDELFESFMSFTKMNNIILNRYYMCNHVYAPLYNDYAQIREEDMRFIERELQGDALVIHLYADEDVIKLRFKTRGEDYVDECKIKTILESYDKFVEECELDVLSFDTGIKTSTEIADIIMDHISY